MRQFVLAIMLACAATIPAAAQAIYGSGSTLCYPVMVKWAEAYEKQTGHHIVYQPIGSDAGITEIRNGIVDFAVSEAPEDSAQLLRDGFAQFPLVMGAIVPVVNIAGVTPGQVRLTGQVLADIYLGKIKKWNDPAIVAVNPGLALPALRIVVIHRSEGSGTTFTFANYLAKVSDDWKAKVGEGTVLGWPAGYPGKGNGGVAEKVGHVWGAIGYVDSAYATRAKLPYALVQNRAGNFVGPDTETLKAATDGIDWSRARDFDMLLTDAPAMNAYPIMATSFALVRRHPKDLGRTRETLAFLRWVLENGGELASAQAYLPVPPALVQQIQGYWETEIH